MAFPFIDDRLKTGPSNRKLQQSVSYWILCHSCCRATNMLKIIIVQTLPCDTRCLTCGIVLDGILEGEAKGINSSIVRFSKPVLHFFGSDASKAYIYLFF